MSDIIQQAIDEYNPSHVFALFSGGDDSVCATHIAAQHPRFTAAVLIDTGIFVQETHDHARAVCEKYNWPLLVYKSPWSYDDFVRRYGFPGPAMHSRMYTRLKERAIRLLIRDYKKKRADKIVLCTGIRKLESERRKIAVKGGIQKQGAAIWAASLWDWTREQRDDFQSKNALPKNPVKGKMHVSGDCLCGAFAHKGDLDILRMFYPTEAKRILKLQDEIIGRFPWQWDEEPPGWFHEHKRGQQFLSDEFMPLCWQCEQTAAVRGAGGEGA